VGEATKNVSGKLEVTVNGTLVHSKAGGHGYVDSDEKRNRIINAVGAALGCSAVGGTTGTASASSSGGSCKSCS